MRRQIIVDLDTTISSKTLATLVKDTLTRANITVRGVKMVLIGTLENLDRPVEIVED